MRKIFKIALTELCTLFYSPIAWLVLIIFTVQACMTYFRLVDIMLMQQFNKPLWYSIAKEMYTGNMGLFPNMLVHLYLYIPLLTMGLMSREYSSGSIKLLYSSPVSSIQIIFGKFLSMMIYSLILVGILFLFVGFTAWNVPSFDMSLALSGDLFLCSDRIIHVLSDFLSSGSGCCHVRGFGFPELRGKNGTGSSFYSGHHVLAVNFRTFRRINQRFDQQ